MVKLSEVRQLMENHIVYKFVGQRGELPVENKPTIPCTVSPFPYIFDNEIIEGQLEPFAQRLEPFPNNRLGLTPHRFLRHTLSLMILASVKTSSAVKDRFTIRYLIVLLVTPSLVPSQRCLDLD